MAGYAKALISVKTRQSRSATWAPCSSPATRSCSASSGAASIQCASSRPGPAFRLNASSRRYVLPPVPRSGETRPSRHVRSPGMGKNTDSGDSLVDYLVRVMFLAVILIVGLAVLGGQVANVLYHV